MDKRQVVEYEYNELMDVIRTTIDKVDTSSFLNQQSKELKSKLVESLKEKLSCVQDSMKRSLDDMHWDKLVISFFGETNAGKSTIIETFRILFDSNRPLASDGNIVGNGESDYTKEYHEYELTINGLPFVLIDVPGIEGEEADFKDGIKKALGRSHCVFYVHGHNKPLETTALGKIQSYLGDWVQVYSIYNVRGNVNNYDEPEERETLFSDSTLKIENEIKNAFYQTLGDVYKGNVTLQALLAMCAKASFAPEREGLSKTQKRFLEYFGSADGILRFSQFQTLINQVEQKAKNFADEISSANMLKVRSLKNEILKELESISSDAGVEQYKLQLERFKSDLKKIADEQRSNLKFRIDSLVNQKFDSVGASVNGIFASKSENKKEELDKCVSKLSDEIQLGIQSIMDGCARSWNEFVERKSANFDGFDNVLLTFPQLQKKGGVKIDFSDALKKMDVSLGDVGGFVAAVGSGALGGSMIPGLGTVAGAIGGAVVFGASYVGQKYAFGDGGVGEAQNSAKRDIADEKEMLNRGLSKLVDELQKRVSDKHSEIDQIAQKEFQSVEEIVSIISDLKIKFKRVCIA